MKIKTRECVLALGFLAALPSLSRADTPPAPANAAAAATGPAIPPQTIFAIAADGTAVHQQSQMQCPATQDGFTRNQFHLFDKAGFDVSCGYRMPGSDVTIYLTKQAPANLATNFEGERQAMLKRFPASVPHDPLAPPPGLDWKSAGMSSNNGVQLDDLLLADVSGWEFQVRATYTAASADATRKVIADLSALTLKTAGAHLAACAATQPPARSGQPVGDVDYLNALAISGMTGARLSPPPATEPVWCIEGAFPGTVISPVFWRNIAFDGKAGDADRIIAADADILEVRLDPAGSDVAAKAGAPMTIYDAILGDADKADLVGIFNGRPSPTDLAKLIYSGPIHRYAHFDRADKKIELFTKAPAAK